MRSGTTLMRLVLDSHERIAIAPETGLMRIVQANKHVPFWMWGSEWYTRLGVGEEELDRELAAFYGGFLRRYAEAHGKRRWGEKTPFHSWHVEQMARLWPRATFVAMVRHPGANIASLVSKWHTPLPAAITKWKGINQNLAFHADSLGERILFCRYEDLVLAAEPTLRELLELLGEPWSQNVRQHDVVHRERGTADIVEGRTRSRDALDAARVAAWGEQLQGAALERVRKETEGLAGFFGYSFEDATAVEALLPDRRVVTGTELAARRADFADVEELQRPPLVPVKERLLRPEAVFVRPRKRKEKGRSRRLRRKQTAEATLTGGNGPGLFEAVKRRLAKLAS
jgi:hypothetical protein